MSHDYMCQAAGSRELFENEVRILIRMSKHKGVAKYHEHGSDGILIKGTHIVLNQTYLVMELVRGKSLLDLGLSASGLKFSEE